MNKNTAVIQKDGSMSSVSGKSSFEKSQSKKIAYKRDPKGPRKILVVDDDPSILDAISMLLEDEGYYVDTSTDGKRITSMKENLPDLFLLDIWMSGIDGRDICRYLKSKHQTKEIPVIMISATKDAGVSALQAGADDFIAKPFEMDELLRKIKLHTN